MKVLACGDTPATCPVRALKDWLEPTCIVDVPVFRPVGRQENPKPRALTLYSIARMVRATAERAALDGECLSGQPLKEGSEAAVPMGCAERSR